MSKIGSRLRQRARELELSDAEVARRAGISARRYGNYVEDKREPDFDTLMKIAQALKVTPDYLFGLGEPSAGLVDLHPIEVISAVQAGVFEEAEEWPPEERYTISAPKLPPEYRDPFGLEVRGESMNLEYPPGSVVVCVRAQIAPEDIKEGDHVVVQRRDKTGLFEATIKEIRQDRDGKFWLWPKSDHPDFQQPVPYPEDGLGHDQAGVDDVAVIAIVVANWSVRKPSARSG